MMLWWKQQFPRVPDLLKDTGQVFAVSVGIVHEKGRNCFVEVLCSCCYYPIPYSLNCMEVM